MQTSYDYEAPAALLGLVSEDFHGTFRDTVIPQVAVKTGQLLTADKASGKVRNAAKLPAAAADLLRPGAMGFAPLDITRDKGTEDWPANRPLAVVRRGRIWLFAETALARWTYPYIRWAGTGMSGALLNAAVADEADQCTQAIILTDADAGGLALVEVAFY